MVTREDQVLLSLEQALSARISSEEVKRWLLDYAIPFHELMAYYRCAMMKVETKFRILNENISLASDSNHIESIKTRLKSPMGIIDKMIRYGQPITVNGIEESLHDVAGVRVICSFVSDIYLLAEALLAQDDVKLIERKDYIMNPKQSGYRSLHLIIETPIYLQDKKKYMKVEVQLRTLAMDTWASLEHKIRYKKSHEALSEEADRELMECAEICAELDMRMERVMSSSSRMKEEGR